jgi:hypothetical protein
MAACSDHFFMSYDLDVPGRRPPGAGLGLSTLALLAGVILSLHNGVALAGSYSTPDSSDPNSTLHTWGLIGSMLLGLAGMVGIFRFSIMPGALTPQVTPMSRSAMLRKNWGVGIGYGLVMLILCVPPAGLFAMVWVNRVHWTGVTGTAVGKPRVQQCLMNGRMKNFYTTEYDYDLGGKRAYCFETTSSLPTSSTRPIWYDPAKPKYSVAGARQPPLMDSLIFFMFMLALCLPAGGVALIWLVCLPQMRANLAGARAGEAAAAGNAARPLPR